MTLSQLDQKRKWIKDKIIVGIYPSRDKHKAFIIDSSGYDVAKSFSFSNNARGFHEQLWFKLKRYLGCELINHSNIIFAVEPSIDFWQPLVDYLHRLDYSVVLVSPLTTRKSRGLPGHDFSRTDPKDARLIAELRDLPLYKHYKQI